MTFFNSIPEFANDASNKENTNKYKILIVDDNEMELLVFRASLKEHITTSFASSAKEALRSLRHKDLPDLIILDVVMPDMNGFELCRKLKNDYHTKNIPIIFLSGQNNLEAKAEAFEAGAVDYVTKPFFPAELEYRIQHQLRMINERRRLVDLAYTDELTGLANRRAYNQTLSDEWSRCMRHKQAITMMLLDIDNFKEYNDGYGHDAGDVAIKKVADEFAKLAVRAGDKCARFGGEELVLLLPECNEQGAMKKAEQAVSSIAALGIAYSQSMHSKVMTVSVGVATAYPSQEIDTLAFFKATDEALYFSKSHGKNRFHLAETIGHPFQKEEHRRA